MPAAVDAPPRAALIEVFASIQGEGRFVGVPMVFVRTAACPLRCDYCDTPHSYSAAASFTVGSGAEARKEPNPALPARVAELVRGLGGAPAPVSATGGEPLLYPRFWVALAAALGPQYPLHLETAAIDPAALAAVLPVLTHVSADYKLPETVGGEDHGDAHRACIALAAAAAVTVDVKLVLTAAVADASVAAALDALRPFRAAIELILQPVTPCNGVAAPPPARLGSWAAEAAAAGFAVRVLPQVHRLLGVP